MKSANQIMALLKKDILLEFRQQYTFYGILLYVASTLFVLFLALDSPEATVWNALFWIIQLFICVNAVAKSFLQESRGRMLYFYSISGAVPFIIAKLFFNVLLMLVLNLLSLFLFMVLMGNPMVHGLQFLGVSILGGLGLSIVFTLLAAIASKAHQQASLMAILGFPIIIPQLLLLMRVSKSAFAEVFKQGAITEALLLLLALDALVIVLSIILFPFLWKD